MGVGNVVARLGEVTGSSPMCQPGCSDVPSEFSAHPKVLTDRNNRIRDLKYPTIGPVEQTPSWIADRQEQRFTYDGQVPVLRQTYRYAKAGNDGAKLISYDKADATRYFHLVNGTMAAVDSDGTTDVTYSDRDGQRWFNYRGRGGRRFWPLATKWHKAAFGEGVSLGQPGESEGEADMRNCLGTGSIDPQSLPGTGFGEFLPFHQWATDGDLMMGRIGVAGWDGEERNWGLFIGEKPEPPKETPHPRRRPGGPDAMTTRTPEIKLPISKELRPGGRGTVVAMGEALGLVCFA